MLEVLSTVVQPRKLRERDSITVSESRAGMANEVEVAVRGRARPIG